MIADVADFFTKGCGRCARFDTPDCSAMLWAKTVAALRQICLEAGLAEELRWGHPCYRHAGRNVALIGALRGEVRLSVFEAGLLDDPEGLLQPGGPNSPQPSVLRLTSSDDLARKTPALRALLAQAKHHAQAGLKAPRRTQDLDLPEELIEALDADPELAEAFHALTPGRQRSHVLALTSAKAAATRTARIERLRPRILAGKGATEL